MKCPSCSQPSMVETMTKGGVLVDICKTCKGVGSIGARSSSSVASPESSSGCSRRSFTEKSLRLVSARAATKTWLSRRFCGPTCWLSGARTARCTGSMLASSKKAMQIDRQAFQLETDDFGALAGDDLLAGSSIDPLEPAHDERAHRRIQDLSSACFPYPTWPSARPGSSCSCTGSSA